MTEEEMQAKIAEAEQKAAEANQKVTDLEKQRSNQNSYITKLESENIGLKRSMDNVKNSVNNAAPAMPQEITEYFQKKRREDYTDQATTEIISKVGKERFDIVKPALDEFLARNMNEKNVSVKFIIDAFSLVYGRACEEASTNPEHPLNKVGVAQQTTTPVAPVKPAVDGNLLNKTIVNNMVNTMTNNDTNAGGAPSVKAPTVANTKEAMAQFKTRLFNGLDSSKFE